MDRRHFFLAGTAAVVAFVGGCALLRHKAQPPSPRGIICWEDNYG